MKVENSDLLDISEKVNHSKIDDLEILPESQEIVNNQIIDENAETDKNDENAQNVQMSQDIPRELLFDENGDMRTDSQGNTFDPALHVVDDNGYPKLTARGKLRKSRTSKKSKIGSSPSPSQVAAKAAVNPNAKYDVIGESCAGGLISLGLMLGGEDFAPVQNQYIDEHKNMSKAFAEWAKSKEIEDLPPNLALTVVIGSYILPRLTKPKQLSKLKLLKMWLASKFTKKPKIKDAGFDPNKEK